MTERQKPTPKATKFSSAGVPAAGATVIDAYLKTLPGAPGVYRMINTKGDVLYVGKAKNLKKRVASYTRADRQPIRTRRMIT